VDLTFGGAINWDAVWATLSVGMAVLTIVVASVAGVGLSLLTISGAWLIALACLAVKIWEPGLLSWWVFGAVAGLALLAEIAEFFASAAGATRAGGSKRGAVAAMIGGVVGAILGSPLLFPLGTIVGGAVGAGVAALGVELAWVKKSRAEAIAIGRGALAGKFVSVIVKTAFTALAALVAVLAVLVPGM
jgi:uncharacterized protein YqgC (DUF456 family)